MESQAQVKVYKPEEGRYKVILEGEKLGQLIGRRGETLDAIQQLTSYCVNRSGEKRVRIHVDAENYRAKREQSLQNLARKVAAKVVRNRRNVTLEPMNAYERHVIHTALQDVEGVTTYSMGTEPHRRVIVAYDRSSREQKRWDERSKRERDGRSRLVRLLSFSGGRRRGSFFLVTAAGLW